MKTELVEFLQGFARDGKVCASDPVSASTFCSLTLLGGVTKRRGGVL